mmetsp:Transcript_18850/g.24283  ORF Transcript_18850/g.24283 Transcript_18850/m.24283 type:complete len:244 (-) Transcript_18850:60-791(-)
MNIINLACFLGLILAAKPFEGDGFQHFQTSSGTGVIQRWNICLQKDCRGPLHSNLFPNPGKKPKSLLIVSDSKPDSGNDEKEPLIKRIGNGIKTAGQVFLVSATVLSIVLAADSIYKLTQQPITLQTIGPALGNLLPLAGLGYVGAVRLVSALVRVIRIVLSIPIVLGGSYYLAPQLPNFFKNSPDATTTGLVALLATPEVLEALVVVSILVTFIFWVFNSLFGMVRSIASSNNNIGDEKFDK